MGLVLLFGVFDFRHSGAMQSIEPGSSQDNLEIPGSRKSAPRNDGFAVTS
jgi:hypothetical protein